MTGAHLSDLSQKCEKRFDEEPRSTQASGTTHVAFMKYLKVKPHGSCPNPGSSRNRGEPKLVPASLTRRKQISSTIIIQTSTSSPSHQHISTPPNGPSNASSLLPARLPTIHTLRKTVTKSPTSIPKQRRKTKLCYRREGTESNARTEPV